MVQKYGWNSLKYKMNKLFLCIGIAWHYPIYNLTIMKEFYILIILQEYSNINLTQNIQLTIQIVISGQVNLKQTWE